MPRRTNRRHLAQRTSPRRLLVLDSEYRFTYEPSPLDQSLILGFYAVGLDLTDEAALAYRKKAMARFPSVPQRAGKAMKRLEANVFKSSERAGGLQIKDFGRRRSAGVKARRTATIRMTHYGELNIDAEGLAQAVVSIAEQGFRLGGGPSPAGSKRDPA